MGDLAHGFDEADVIIEHTYVTPGVHQSYIEPQAVLMEELQVEDGRVIGGDGKARRMIANFFHWQCKTL
ncbi:MAG TPA: molybdopterin cofactor-binding domain-containing protein [Candidatus Tectomicrobia bacterium]|nr:molybdopterin cofactor-binding domain-containing protein [Candidatus Tectomicrobia bacterium]